MPARLAPPFRRLAARFLPEGAVLLSVLTLGAYLTGLARDRIFARTFGAGIELDAYNAAFVLPELTLDVLVAGGLAAPFIPIFAGLKREDVAAAHLFARTILTLSVLVMAAAAALLFVFAPQSADLITPGFGARERELYVALFRVMCLTPIVFAASIALGEILVAEQRFLYYGLAALLYNAGIILGTLALGDSLGIFGAAVGAVIGALLHLGIRLLGIVRSPFRPGFALAVRTRAVAEFIRLMLPKMASHPIEPLTFLFFTALATTFGAGAVSAVSFARNFQSVPVSLVGASFSLAVFPILSAAYAAGDRRRFGGLLVSNLASIGLLTAGAALGLWLVGGLAIEVLLGGGAFDAEDVALTTLVLSGFALSVPLESLSHLLSRALYATRNTLLQVLASLAGFAITVAASLLLAPAVGIVAIPLGFSAGLAVKVALLALALAPRVRRMPPPAAQVELSAPA
ncbi:MAG TPA: lipid II flippase MurJ [Candidatus Limnocylindrales bacterium]|nr:lipid II flippase MurJ [Candidatus Limnocylindrales bacterium]